VIVLDDVKLWAIGKIDSEARASAIG